MQELKLDEAGYKLIAMSYKENSISKSIGNILVQALPKVIKSLAVIGTIVLIMVAGGIFAHNIAFFHHFAESLPAIVKEFALGLFFGFLVLGIVTLIKKIFKKH